MVRTCSCPCVSFNSVPNSLMQLGQTGFQEGAACEAMETVSDTRAAPTYSSRLDIGMLDHIRTHWASRGIHKYSIQDKLDKPNEVVVVGDCQY